MRSLRRTLVAAVIAVMVLGIAGASAASVTVAGKPFTDIAGHAHEKELTMMAALGIMKGDTGTTTVRPDAAITRAEAAIVIVRMLGREAIANALATYQPAFSDAVPTWAWGHVNVATNMGIIKGYGDGTFRASNNVTHAEALAMLVRATGHEPGVIGTWPINYMMAGYDLGIIGSVEAFANLPATRGEIAHFTYNTLFIKQGKVSATTGYDPEGELSILAKAGRAFIGTVASYNLPDKKLTFTGAIGTKDLAGSVYLWTYTGFAELVNAQLRAVADAAKKIVYIEPYVLAEVVRGTFQKVAVDSADALKKIYLTDGSKYPVRVASGDDMATLYRLNSALSDESAIQTDYNATDGTYKGELSVALTLEKGKVALLDGLHVNVDNAVLQSTKVKGVSGATYNAVNIGVEYTVPDTAVVTLNGAAATVADLKKNDVVYISTEGAIDMNPAIKVEAIRQTVQGVVQNVRTIYTTPTKFYTMADLKLADGSIKAYQLDSALSVPVEGSTVIYGLNKAGYARVAIAATMTTAYVKMTGYQAAYGLSTPAIGTFDVAGTATSYPVAAGGPTYLNIGSVGKLAVNAATGQATALVEVAAAKPVGLAKGRVFSVDAVNNIVTVQVYGADKWLQEYKVSTKLVTAYLETKVTVTTGEEFRIGTFVKPTDMAAGTLVYYALATAATAVETTDVDKVIFLLKKYDQTMVGW